MIVNLSALLSLSSSTISLTDSSSSKVESFPIRSLPTFFHIVVGLLSKYSQMFLTILGNVHLSFERKE